MKFTENHRMDKFGIPSWSARNPLGIVALFISLIYGMSALLLGTSVSSLSPSNQTILVIFIASFPFVVLGVFGWLVARHHMKLYGPSDYRTDKSFLDAFGALPPSEVAKKLEREISEAEATAPQSPLENQADESKTPKPEVSLPSEATGRSTSLKQAFLSESLVFQALQNEFLGPVRRNIRLPNGTVLDGIIEERDGSILVVEIKFVRNARNIADVFYRFQRQIEAMLFALSTTEQLAEAKIILALVFDDTFNNALTDHSIEKFRTRFGPRIQIRVYSASKLLSEYGLLETPLLST